MVATMVFAITQLLAIGWFGFIGVVLASLCEDAHDAIENSDCLYVCRDNYSGAHVEDACTSTDGDRGIDCCASLDWGERKTCAPGHTVDKPTESSKAHTADQVRDFCDLMGLMVLTALVRFGLVLTISICTCLPLCCGPASVGAHPSTQIIVHTASTGQPQAVTGQLVPVPMPVRGQPVLAGHQPMPVVARAVVAQPAEVQFAKGHAP